MGLRRDKDLLQVSCQTAWSLSFLLNENFLSFIFYIFAAINVTMLKKKNFTAQRNFSVKNFTGKFQHIKT